MKNIVRLMLFFSLCFAVLFLSAIMVRYLHIRIDAVRFLPARPEQPREELISAAQWALPVTVYLDLLVGLSYSVRRRIPFILSMIIMISLTGAFSTGISMGVDGLVQVPFPQKSPKVLGYPGLILTQADTVMVLLQDPAEAQGPRVAFLPGQPLLYQEAPVGPDNTILSLPAASFRSSLDRFLQSLTLDFSLTGQQFALRFSQGRQSFLIYGGSLIFLLISLRFILNLSSWPLANLFLGALAFRGILSLETFLNADNMQERLLSLLGERVPSSYITPLAFCVLAILICLYTSLNWLTMNMQKANDGD